MNYDHIPVLLNEVISYLDTNIGQNFVDVTLGGGGYSKRILEEIGDTGKLLSIDLDKDAIENYKKQITNNKNAIAVHGNFSQIDHIVTSREFPAPDGIVADLGLSSYELDQAGRGISFQKKELLDMRFDQGSSLPDAKFILNYGEESDLRNIFEEYGEDKFSRQIARKIVESRQEKTESGLPKHIHYTTDLYQLIVDALPKPVKHKADDSARRIFQALRIEVNHELENLETFLPRAFDVLKPGGRLVIVSFHSLEDRIVKQFFLAMSKGCVCPPEFPQCICGKGPQGRILTKKIVTASEEELIKNPRSKPAKLRAIMKL
jgi:16S rRNA (cytosine1402-N4)-methyltransferase